MNHAESGIIVAGAIRDSHAEQAVLRLAEASKWPIVSDVLSNLRFVQSDSIAHFADLALLDDKIAGRSPDVVLQFGGRLVSKRLQSYLDKGGGRAHIYVDDHDTRLDPGCVVTHRIETDVESFANALTMQVVSHSNMSPLLLKDSAIVERTLKELRVDESLNEISVARTLLAHMDDSQFLFCASSMPIRDLNMFASPHPNPPRLYANRGASGIDGIVSTACGVSKALQKPGVLLSGDLTFVHDTNGLSLLKSLRDPLTIVVVNNRGGGIFTMLDIHKQKDIFTPYFDAEHDVGLGELCHAYQIKHRRVSERAEWVECLADVKAAKEHMVIEVSSDKWQNKELHDQVREAIRVRFGG
jgi:2-succinyl-5-enolpyruvyl-6-hydroxy-3-cyclohexene-1-carboxylate synthase